ncbi:MAG: hypothetical protein JO001_22385 [Alphaproteobacteria bacterium]|nr:hypothetical protein [Alphaproteobacteria bacterium]
MLLASGAAITSVALTGRVPMSVLVVVNTPLLFFLTGYALLRALRVVGTTLAEHAVYSAGASIAVCIAGGFLLNWLGCLSPSGWAGWLASVTAASVAVSWLRGHDDVAARRWRPTPYCRTWHVVVFATAIAITGAAYALDVRDEAHHRQFKYTEFWMLPMPSAPGTLVVGISSAEDQAKQFDVEVRLDGATVALLQHIELHPAETWTHPIDLPSDANHALKAEAFLYDAPNESIYRKVSLVMPEN